MHLDILSGPLPENIVSSIASLTEQGNLAGNIQQAVSEYLPVSGNLESFIESIDCLVTHVNM